MDKMIRLATVVVIAIAATAGTLLAYRYAFSQSAEDYAVKVNGKRITKADVDDAVARKVRLATLVAQRSGRATTAPSSPPDRGQTVQELIDATLLGQEAARRGYACTDGEAESTLRTQLVTMPGGDSALVAAIGSGIAPLDYLQTPAGQRTPEDTVVIGQYATDARVIAAARALCVTSKLFATLGSPAPGIQGGVSADSRTAAIGSLKAELLQNASIEREPGY